MWQASSITRRTDRPISELNWDGIVIHGLATLEVVELIQNPLYTGQVTA